MSSAEYSAESGTYLERPRLEGADLWPASDRIASTRRPVGLGQHGMRRLSRTDTRRNQAMARSARDRRIACLGTIGTTAARLNAREFGYGGDCRARITDRRPDLAPTVNRCIACAG